MGVFPVIRDLFCHAFRLPHERGGVSTRVSKWWFFKGSSPRTWGCFPKRIVIKPCHIVFPTNVGVFLGKERGYTERQGLPHERGGVSSAFFIIFSFFGSSPRTWGCFFTVGGKVVFARVFPTNVGVFLLRDPYQEALTSLPHERGGVSKEYLSRSILCMSSPRTWGCFSLQGGML